MIFWPKDFWPPQSLNLNQLDYSRWLHIENKACKDCHNNTEELEVSVNRDWTLVSKDYVCKVCKAFWPQLSCVIGANGGCIEYQCCLNHIAVIVTLNNNQCYITP